MNIIGYDIGGTKCAVTLGRTTQDNTELCDIVDKEGFATNNLGYEVIIKKLYDTTEKMLHKHGYDTSDIHSIGISCGGPLDSKAGTILSPPNLPGWENVHIIEDIERHFGTKAILANDADACAVAEWKFGAGKGFKNIVFLTFGTGMGAGLILDGRLYTGANNMAGEVGHIRLANDGPVGYGKKGSFEGFCSGGGIAKMAQLYKEDFLNKGGYSYLLDINKTPNAKELALAMNEGDPFASMIYDICAEKLGRGLSILIDILNPECIIIGSIYERNEDYFKKRIIPIIKEEALERSFNVCKIIPAALGDSIGDYAALGVALL